jgi:hypothetical protein
MKTIILGDNMNEDEKKKKKQEYLKQWAKDNPEKRIQYVKKWADKNKDRVNEIARRYYLKNKKAINERSVAWRKNNPEAHKAIYERGKKKAKESSPEKVKQQRKKTYEKNKGKRLEKKYNLEPGGYEKMLEQQDNKCGICMIQFDVYKAAHNRSFAVDHCHATGKTRGLLCHGCNLSLGYMQDSTTSISNSIQYLNQHIEEK